MIFHHTDFTQLSLSLAGYSKSNTKATHLCVIGGPNPQVLLLMGIGVGGVDIWHLFIICYWRVNQSIK